MRDGYGAVSDPGAFAPSFPSFDVCGSAVASTLLQDEGEGDAASSLLCDAAAAKVICQ